MDRIGIDPMEAVVAGLLTEMPAALGTALAVQQEVAKSELLGTLADVATKMHALLDGAPLSTASHAAAYRARENALYTLDVYLSGTADGVREQVRAAEAKAKRDAIAKQVTDEKKPNGPRTV